MKIIKFTLFLCFLIITLIVSEKQTIAVCQTPCPQSVGAATNCWWQGTDWICSSVSSCKDQLTKCGCSYPTIPYSSSAACATQFNIPISCYTNLQTQSGIKTTPDGTCATTTQVERYSCDGSCRASYCTGSCYYILGGTPSNAYCEAVGEVTVLDYTNPPPCVVCYGCGGGGGGCGTDGNPCPVQLEKKAYAWTLANCTTKTSPNQCTCGGEWYDPPEYVSGSHTTVQCTDFSEAGEYGACVFRTYPQEGGACTVQNPVCAAQTPCTPSCPAGQSSSSSGGVLMGTASCTYQTGAVTGSGTCETANVTTNCYAPQITCTKETCTPTCPAGQFPYDTGGPLKGTASCTYKTGVVKADNTCETSTNIANCYDPLVSCTKETCSLDCPAGQIPYDTGGSLASTQSCTYESGVRLPNNTCEQLTNTLNCYNDSNPPVVTIGGNTASALGCTAPTGTIGSESNNVKQFTVTYDDLSATDQNEALLVWLSPTSAPMISKVYDTGTGDLLLNNSYGLLVRKVSGVWRDIYIPGVVGSDLVWRKAGTIGAGLRAEILGSGGSKMIGIRDVSVSTASSKNNLVFSLHYYTSTSGVTPFEKATDANYKIFAVASRRTTFLPSGGDTIAIPITPKDTSSTILVDLTAPVNDYFSYTVGANDHVSIAWKYTDAMTAILRVFGDADRVIPGTIEGPISDLTLPGGTANYTPGTGATGAAFFNGYHLWKIGVSSRTEDVDLLTNLGGTFRYTSWGFDSACNYTSVTLNMSLGNTWIVTKGGIANAGSGTDFDMKTLSGTDPISADTYWNSPFGFIKNQADIATELLYGSTNTLTSFLHSDITGAVNLKSYADSNNTPNYWYEELKTRALALADSDVTKYNNMSFTGDLSLPQTGRSPLTSQIYSGTNHCVNTKNCIVRVSGNLTVNGTVDAVNGFRCDTRTLFLVEGNITIRPDIGSTAMNYGCMFLAKGDIVIGAGTYKSSGSTYPKYDIVGAFMLADGVISMPAADAGQPIRDGLKINGSLLAFGSLNGQSIHIARALKLIDSETFPAVAIHYDQRYLSFAPLYFAEEGEGFETEVGFKPL